MEGDPGVGVGEAVGGAFADPIATPDQKRPRAVEELEWKDRALEAERELEAAQSRLAEVEAELARAKSSVESLELAQQIDAQLVKAQAIDLETARLLVQAQLSAMETPDVGRAVAEVRSSKAFLFEGQVSSGRALGYGSAASASTGMNASSAHLIDEAAEEARRSGDRRALLRYLRVRRGV